MSIAQEREYESATETYKQVSVEAEASYGGLFYSGNVSGGYRKSKGNASLSESGSDVTISFKVHKVLIQRPWLETYLLNYPTIGIKALDKHAWSTGKLDYATNKGEFPLLPTAFVVAKDVTISAKSFNETATKSFSQSSKHAGFKVNVYACCCKNMLILFIFASQNTQVGIGCFGASGNYSSSEGSKDSSSKYDAASKTLKINGAQIIGWVCAAIPEFPHIKA